MVTNDLWSSSCSKFEGLDDEGTYDVCVVSVFNVNFASSLIVP